MKINRINSAMFGSFSARGRISQNEKSAINVFQPVQYGDLSQDNLLTARDFLNLIGEDGISPALKTYDSFTGLRDKNYLLAVLNKAIKDSKNSKKSLSIAMFDMDNFKSVNELLGYEAGDNFIKIMSGDIYSTSNNHGIFAYRYGGDEFVLIFGDQSPEARDTIVNSILSKFKANSYINSMMQRYKINAEKKLSEYIASSSKIREITELKAQNAILKDLIANFSPEAQSEPYLVQKFDQTNIDIRALYLELISDAMKQECDKKRRKLLTEYHKIILFNQPLSEDKQKPLDEYLTAMYDKSAEIYQIRKWIKDYNMSGGFGFTASIVDYTPQMLEGKKPSGIINEIGESLKQGKAMQKGQQYLYSVSEKI